MDVIDDGTHDPKLVTPPERAVVRSVPSWLVRAVPGLILGSGLVAAAAAMLLAARSGINAPVSKQVSIGPFDLLLVYSTPTPELVVSALVTVVAVVVLVIGLDAWAAQARHMIQLVESRDAQIGHCGPRRQSIGRRDESP